MDNLIRDVRYALRTLQKNPGFTAVSVVALALGIGVNTSIFTLYNAIALRPLPVKDPGRVACLYRTTSGESGAGVFSYPEYADYRDRGQVFSGLAAWSWTGLTMGTSDRAEPVRAMFVSGNYFDVLGAATAVGRRFIPEEDRTPGSHPVVVLSYRFWERRFAHDPAVVGRPILLNGHSFTVVGVVASNFVGTDPVEPEAWVPLMMKATLAPVREDVLNDRNGHWLQVIGRLKQGVSWKQARAVMDVCARQLAQTYPEEQKSGVLLAAATFMPPNVEKSATPIVILVMSAVGLVLLVACANVANLLLARAASRQKEIGIRLSLGATRVRLVRLFLTESVLMAIMGGAAGLLLASWASTVLLRLVKPPFEHGTLNFDVSPDVRVLGYTFAISVLTGIIFGLVPAFSASKAGVNDLIKRAATTRRRTWAAGVLVMAQVGLCVVLLVAAGLLLRALGRAQTTDPGFDTKHVLALSLDLRLHHYDQAAAEEFERRVVERLKSVPGVRTVSLTATVPLGTDFMATGVAIEGREPKSDGQPMIVSQNFVTPEFFETLGIPLVRGRGFENGDSKSGPEVAIVNETMARRFWPGENPTGKRLRVGPSKDYVQIVGVVKNTRSSYLWEPDEPYIYTPVKAGNHPEQDMKVLVRTAADAQRFVAVLPGVVRGLDNSVQVSSKVLEENLETWIWPSRMGAMLATAFGVLALVLAAVGIYGVVAYTVSRRTHEIGIHVALGAQRGDVLRLVLSRGMLLAAAGLVLGLAGGFALSRLLAQFLYGLSAADPVTFGGVALALAAVTLAANYVPARRALRVDPMMALRHE